MVTASARPGREPACATPWVVRSEPQLHDQLQREGRLTCTNPAQNHNCMINFEERGGRGGVWHDARMIAAVVAVALAATVALAAVGPVALLVAALAVVQAVVASRWFVAVDVPGGWPGMVVGTASGIGADVVVAVRDDQRPLTPVSAVVGLAVLAALLQQLARRDGRERLTASLAATATLAVVTALAAGHVGARLSEGGAPLVVAGVLAAAAVVVLGTVPVPRVLNDVATLLRLSAGLVLAVLLGLVTGLGSDLGAGTGAVIGLGGGLVAVVTGALCRRLTRPDPALTAGLPLLLCGPVAFVLGRLFAG